MGLVFLLDRVPLSICRIDQLGGELARHSLTAARTRILENPAHRQRDTAVCGHFDRHLIGRTANTARLDFDGRGNVTQRLIEDFDRALLEALFDDVERFVHDALRGAALAAVHHPVDEHRDVYAIELVIRRDDPLRRAIASWHLYTYLFLPAGAAGAPAFGRLAPYLLRACKRPLTPSLSSVPRTM